MKDIYKTVWEIKMKTVIDLAADRGAFVDQSQVCTDDAHLFLALEGCFEWSCLYYAIRYRYIRLPT